MCGCSVDPNWNSPRISRPQVLKVVVSQTLESTFRGKCWRRSQCDALGIGQPNVNQRLLNPSSHLLMGLFPLFPLSCDRFSALSSHGMKSEPVFVQHPKHPTKRCCLAIWIKVSLCCDDRMVIIGWNCEDLPIVERKCRPNTTRSLNSKSEAKNPPKHSSVWRQDDWSRQSVVVDWNDVSIDCHLVWCPIIHANTIRTISLPPNKMKCVPELGNAADRRNPASFHPQRDGVESFFGIARMIEERRAKARRRKYLMSWNPNTSIVISLELDLKATRLSNLRRKTSHSHSEDGTPSEWIEQWIDLKNQQIWCKSVLHHHSQNWRSSIIIQTIIIWIMKSWKACARVFLERLTRKLFPLKTLDLHVLKWQGEQKEKKKKKKKKGILVPEKSTLKVCLSPWKKSCVFQGFDSIKASVFIPSKWNGALRLATASLLARFRTQIVFVMWNRKTPPNPIEPFAYCEIAPFCQHETRACAKEWEGNNRQGKKWWSGHHRVVGKNHFRRTREQDISPRIVKCRKSVHRCPIRPEQIYLWHLFVSSVISFQHRFIIKFLGFTTMLTTHSHFRDSIECAQNRPFSLIALDSSSASLHPSSSHLGAQRNAITALMGKVSRSIFQSLRKSSSKNSPKRRIECQSISQSREHHSLNETMESSLISKIESSLVISSVGERKERFDKTIRADLCLSSISSFQLIHQSGAWTSTRIISRRTRATDQSSPKKVARKKKVWICVWKIRFRRHLVCSAVMRFTGLWGFDLHEVWSNLRFISELRIISHIHQVKINRKIGSISSHFRPVPNQKSNHRIVRQCSARERWSYVDCF